MTEQAETLTEIRDALARINKHMEEEVAVEAPPVMEETTLAKEEEAAVAYIDSLDAIRPRTGRRSSMDFVTHFGLGKAYMVGVDGKSTDLIIEDKATYTVVVKMQH